MKRAISKDGTQIAFKKIGTGNPILLVHGTTADHTRWESITPRLKEHFAVYAMDRRGRGESGDGLEFFHDAVKIADEVLPNSTIVSMPGEQHIAMDTNPDLFIQEVVNFLLGNRNKHNHIAGNDK